MPCCCFTSQKKFPPTQDEPTLESGPKICWPSTCIDNVAWAPFLVKEIDWLFSTTTESSSNDEIGDEEESDLKDVDENKGDEDIVGEDNEIEDEYDDGKGEEREKSDDGRVNLTCLPV